jgi:hypothetical protein
VTTLWPLLLLFIFARAPKGAVCCCCILLPIFSALRLFTAGEAADRWVLDAAAAAMDDEGRACVILAMSLLNVRALLGAGDATVRYTTHSGKDS